MARRLDAVALLAGDANDSPSRLPTWLTRTIPMARRSADDVVMLPSMDASSMPQPGQPAPEFSLPDQDGRRVSLSAFAGRTVVLYFYPRADTPGCTTQACSIRDRGGEYEAAGATVLGVSPDPVDAVKKFHAKQSLNFTLLADADHAVCERYGVWGERSMYGKTYMGAQRSTFIIDGSGTVVHVIPKASPKTHDDEVLAALADLSGAAA